ncbi:sn-glycerol-1-phosphate dehydrogenase [Cohnella lubricantis]|uniref:sn-glycerol-1-phosphate dehydrogenase n=1 Tax=Cohnella lubricantis TaxID=2163172 RepID=A0A841TD09_9BACL|nr:sn-glycerol-1-phosphate dehydrogenase [Cohnella lubricantis]MBB6676341.1 sn-glycerol-1-phosphate dehydrogenase [Cohnella lubricantis]MBP2120290.1 glycerol-1-phosphate dehydrogenase [NAD(P)+] [Cohnella lubricantis]
MTDLARRVYETAEARGVRIEVPFPEPIVAEAGALSLAAPYIREKRYRKPLVVADENTYRAAGARLMDEMAAVGLAPELTLVLPDRLGDVIADEASIVQTLLDVQRYGADVIVAAGSGTLHDISRYAAYTAGLSFVSVPTAASVDGFNSRGAPLVIRGEKITVQAIGPIAIFADLDVLRKAPPAMAAAGFGDMLGKLTSLFDWQFGRMTGGEPYSELVADITEQALRDCIENVQAIGSRTEAGIRILMQSLVESGLAMLMLGQSHPASGAEHHLSHYWEMELMRTGRRALLHGAKVGVACAEISALYHSLAAEQAAGGEEEARALRQALDRVPAAETIRGWLREAGGPATIRELGISEELLQRSLAEAHRIRPNRFTLLRAYNDGRAALRN